MKVDSRIIFGVALLSLASLLGCSGKSSQPDYIVIGNLLESYNKNPDKYHVKDIPYRVVTYTSEKTGEIKSNIDMIDLIMKASSGEAVNSEVLIGVRLCRFVAKPYLTCVDSSYGKWISLSTNDHIQSALLHLQQDQQAYLVGRILGVGGLGDWVTIQVE